MAAETKAATPPAATSLHAPRIAREAELAVWQVEATVGLLDDGATLPFIARYRKEATGGLDEVQVGTVRDRTVQLRELDKRRAAILKSLEERELLTEELAEQVHAAQTMTALEDTYLPYRPKRRTRAMIARERGLEPLARSLLAQGDMDLDTEARAFIDAEKGVETAEDALAGARDIIAEQVSEGQEERARIRRLFVGRGYFSSRIAEGKEADGAKYRDYFEWDEPAAAAPSHRILAMFRGESEGFLKLKIGPPEQQGLDLLEPMAVTGGGATSRQVALAVRDGYRRLLAPSMETELRRALKERADQDAIAVFARNLRQLLLAPPLGQKSVMAIDPGFRTGCKVACLDPQGGLRHSDTVYPHTSKAAATEAGRKLLALCLEYRIQAIAIGNGTGGRETETFVRGLDLPSRPEVVMVNESGASVYSASAVAREEFPDQDLTVRGAVSIGRRLMDPLAELVKIEPRSIGVGQYQHDVDATALQQSLSEVVSSCVNGVGVETNTASKQLLSHVSGLGPRLAQGIVDYAADHGPFKSREELKKVPRLGEKAFQQAAGFLRIADAENPLDRSAVHPESYPVVEAMARDLGCMVADLMRDERLRGQIDFEAYVSEQAGMPTLVDIMEELSRPGRDPRPGFESFQFAQGVEKLEDLREGQRLPGIVTNITSFGAFVDVGVHQDGLVHVSQLSDKYVGNPSDVVKVNQKVTVTVLSVDLERKRIALSLRSEPKED